MKKLNEKQIEEIKELSKKLSGREIAKMFKVSQRTIQYHVKGSKEKESTYKRNNYQKLSKKERTNLYLKQKSYLKEYMKRRYREDPEFREKHKKRMREYKKKND